MDSLKLPTTAAKAKVFMGNGSLSFPTSTTAQTTTTTATTATATATATTTSISGPLLTDTLDINNSAVTNNNDNIINPFVKKEDGSQDFKSVIDDSKKNISFDVNSNNNNIVNDANDDSSASGIVPTLQNIVATVNLDCRLELKTIALHARNAEYNPKRFAAVIMRIREPKTTALIFASGKMVVTGAKSEDDSKLAARKYARIIQKLGFNAKFTDFKIQNIVGSCDVKFPIRLEGLAYAHGTFSSYEPELFPGLIYRMVKPKIVLLIFVSGKIVLTGAKQREEIYRAFEEIYPVLSEFRKN